MYLMSLFRGLVLDKSQEDGLRRIEELKMELNLLQQANSDEKKRQIHLEQEHETLTEELTKEKVPLIPNSLNTYRQYEVCFNYSFVFRLLWTR